MRIYIVKEDYINYLKKFDDNIRDNKNESRPYIGILLEVNGMNYIAPLASPKEKHKSMKNNIDFFKLENGDLGVINLNNMIPIPKEKYKEIDIKQEIQNNKKYGIILKYQIKWCNKNREKIIGNAQKLYNLIINKKANLKLSQRCCDFKFLEAKLNQFILNQEKSE